MRRVGREARAAVVVETARRERRGQFRRRDRFVEDEMRDHVGDEIVSRVVRMDLVRRNVAPREAARFDLRPQRVAVRQHREPVMRPRRGVDMLQVLPLLVHGEDQHHERELFLHHDLPEQPLVRLLRGLALVVVHREFDGDDVRAVLQQIFRRAERPEPAPGRADPGVHEPAERPLAELLRQPVRIPEAVRRLRPPGD